MSIFSFASRHRPSRQQVYFSLVVLEGFASGPLAYALPFSRLALGTAVAFLVAMNATLLAGVQSRSRASLLHGANLAGAGVCLALTLDEGLRQRVERPALLIAAMSLVVFLVGAHKLSSRSAKECFAAQQFALCATCLSFLLTSPIISKIVSEQAHGYIFLRGGVTALFFAPLAFVAVASAAGHFGWNSYLVFLASICVAQAGSGFIEVGVARDSSALAEVGLALAIAFVLLLLFAWILERRRIRVAKLKGAPVT